MTILLPEQRIRKPRALSPTARSLARLRSEDALAGVVEKWNPHAKIRQDLFGFVDILAIEPGRSGVTAIQACITKDMQKRVRKMLAEPIRDRVVRCLDANNRVYVWGWAKQGPRGKPKVWCLTVLDMADEIAVSSARELPERGTHGR